MGERLLRELSFLLTSHLRHLFLLLENLAHLLAFPTLFIKQLLKLLDLVLGAEKTPAVDGVRLHLVFLVWLVELLIHLRSFHVRRREAHQPHWLPFDRLDGVWVFKGVGWDVAATLFSNVTFQLLNPRLLALHARFSLQSDPVVSVQLLLQLNDRFVSFIQSRSQSNHDVALFEQELFVAVYLGLSLLNLVALSLDLIQFDFVLLSDPFLLLFQRRSELGGVLDFFTSVQHLRVHRLDFVFEDAFVLLGLQEFVRPDLQRVNCRVLVRLGLLFLLLKLRDLVASDGPLLFSKL